MGQVATPGSDHIEEDLGKYRIMVTLGGKILINLSLRGIFQMKEIINFTTALKPIHATSL